MRVKLKTVYSRMFIVVVVFCSTMMVVYNLIVLGVVGNTYNDYSIVNHKQLLRQTTTYFDEVMSNLTSNAARVANDPNVLKAAGYPSSTRYSRNNDIVTVLESICDNSPFIEKVYVMYNANGFIITSEGLVTFADNISDSILQNVFRKDPTEDELFRQAENADGGTQKLYYLVPFAKDRKFNLGKIVIELNGDMFSKLLDDVANERGSGYYFLTGSNDVWAKSAWIPEDALLTEREFTDKLSREEYILSGDYYYFFQQSASSMLRYISIVQRGQVEFSAQHLNSIVIPMALVILALLLFFSGFVTNKLYRPVKRLANIVKSDRHPPLKTDGHPEANEYKLIEDHVQKLQRDNQRKETVIQEITPFMEEALLLSLLRGKDSENERNYYSKFVNLAKMESRGFLVAMLGLDKPGGEDRSDELNMIYRKLSKDDSECRTYCFRVNSSELSVILYRMDERSDQEFSGGIVQYFAELMQDAASEEEEFSFTVGISNIHTGLSEMYIASKEAEMALSYRTYMPNGSCILYADVAARERGESNRENSGRQLDNYERKIINAIASGKESELETSVNEFYKSLTEYAGTDREYITFAISITLWQVSKYYESVNIIDITMIGKLRDQRQILDSMENAGEMIRYMKDICITIQQKLLHAGLSDQSKYTAKIINHIAENYQNSDLSLETISSYLGISKSYVSTVFKREFNMNYVDYLRNVRIGKAKELLCNTNASIQEIGEQVGFGSVQSFIRTFSALEGITPSKYRERIGKINEIKQ